jgi:hypothetical protein
LRCHDCRPRCHVRQFQPCLAADASLLRPA